MSSKYIFLSKFVNIYFFILSHIILFISNKIIKSNINLLNPTNLYLKIYYFYKFFIKFYNKCVR